MSSPAGCPSSRRQGTTKSIEFVYDAAGGKLRKTTTGGAAAENYQQDYADGIEYRAGALEAIYHDEGRLTPQTGGGWQYEYSIRDHLGNTRLTFADKNDCKVINVTNCRAFCYLTCNVISFSLLKKSAPRIFCTPLSRS